MQLSLCEERRSKSCWWVVPSCFDISCPPPLCHPPPLPSTSPTIIRPLYNFNSRGSRSSISCTLRNHRLNALKDSRSYYQKFPPTSSITSNPHNRDHEVHLKKHTTNGKGQENNLRGDVRLNTGPSFDDASRCTKVVMIHIFAPRRDSDLFGVSYLKANDMHEKRNCLMMGIDIVPFADRMGIAGIILVEWKNWNWYCIMW